MHSGPPLLDCLAVALLDSLVCQVDPNGTHRPYPKSLKTVGLEKGQAELGLMALTRIGPSIFTYSAISTEIASIA